MARILIAGCGDVGCALGERLAGAGHTVFGLRRAPDALPAAIEPVAADLTAPASLAAVPAGIDAVCYAAAAGQASDAAYRAVYVDGVRHLLGALTGRGEAVRRFLFVSSTGVYAQDGGEWVDEDSPAAATRFSGARLLEGEALALGGPFPASVVRFGGIYGPGRERLVRRAREGAPCRAGAYTNRIHRDDCAGVLEHLLAMRAPAPVYIGVDHAPVPECEVVDWIAAHLGLVPPPRGEGGVAGKRCRNDRLLAAGYRFRYPTYREGYAAVLGDRR